MNETFLEKVSNESSGVVNSFDEQQQPWFQQHDLLLSDEYGQKNDVIKVLQSAASAPQLIPEDVLIWSVIDGFLLIVILCGNTLTILAVLYSRRLRSIISNLFVLSLAISDLFVGLTLPYHLTFYIGIGLGEIKFYCLLRFFLIIFAWCLSIWNLMAIAIDRYIAICYPLHYGR